MRPHVERSKYQFDTNKSTSWSEHIKNLLVGCAAIVSSIAVPLVGIYYTDRQKEREIIAGKNQMEVEQHQKDRELGKGFVEMGTKILSAKPIPEAKPLRSWAIDIINHYAEVKIPDQVREALLTDQPLFQSAQGIISKARLEQLLHPGLTLGVAIWRVPHVDWDALRAEGVRFAYIYPSGGGRPIPGAADLLSEAPKKGIAVGVAHTFTDRLGNPIVQADQFIAELGQHEWMLPPLIDCEAVEVSSPQTYPDHLFTFIARVEEATKIKPIIYIEQGFAKDILSSRFSKYSLAYGRYATKTDTGMPTPPQGWEEITFWHLADSVTDVPAFRDLAILVFNGDEVKLSSLERPDN